MNIHDTRSFIQQLDNVIIDDLILAYQVSDRITLEFATETLRKLKRKIGNQFAEGAYIHFNQGVHYTSPIYQKLVKQYKLGQSVSRRGNCWDNAPQESFFGHFKDEAAIAAIEMTNLLKQFD